VTVVAGGLPIDRARDGHGSERASSLVSRSTSSRIMGASRVGERGAPDAEHTVRGECAASGHGHQRGLHGERNVGILAAACDLEERELLLASDR